ncbi:MAG TPA: 3',5'-cyclic-AMP phosphodiesterase [Gammaproteobacteria bacterium]|nr:3',5'-cyclic-AMP phosphodiesterase [Gammaproteobacteria bacterium]
MDEPLRLIQISDTHLSADPRAVTWGLNNQARLQRVLDDALRRVPEPDALLLTGDLVHDESAAGYRRLARMLATLPAPVLCLPGNHDDPAVMRRFLSESPLRCGGSHRLGGWLVILLDSHVDGQDAGALSLAELAALERALGEDPQRPTLVCLHHHPVPVGSAWLDDMGLSNAGDMFRILDRHTQVRGIVCGHVHQAFDRRRGRVRILATPATTRQFRPGSARFALGEQSPGYRWLHLYGEGRLETGVARLAPGEGGAA